MLKNFQKRLLQSLFITFFFSFPITATVSVGIDVLIEDMSLLQGKRVGLITNHTAVSTSMLSTMNILKMHTQLQAIFSPEHGIHGLAHAAEHISSNANQEKIPIYSLYGATRRPTPEMLKNVDILIYDIQDIGSRSYTYITTLFYAMEEAAKHRIPFIVLDRPNPMGGLIVDGPMLDEDWRSYVGYVNVPYCHGMTVGELAKFFNNEYQVGCSLTVIPMKGWKREMTFQETGLNWTPTSPHIPEDDTPFYYPTTGILGELQIVNIGVGYTLPFKIVGAPWIHAETFAQHLNKQNYPGVHFQPFYFKPFYGRFKGESCQGVRIVITNPKVFQPVSTQYLLIGILKSLYPFKFKQAIESAKSRKQMFCQVNGTSDIYTIMTEQKYIAWPLKKVHQKRRKQFLKLRQKYLIPEYSS